MWFEGTHEDFIAVCAKRFVPGRGTTKHFFGVSMVEVNGDRARGGLAIIGRTGFKRRPRAGSRLQLA